MRLSELHKLLSPEELAALATRVDTSPAYLWQLATKWRNKKPSLDLIKRLAEADARLTVAELVEEFTETPVVVTSGEALPAAA